MFLDGRFTHKCSLIKRSHKVRRPTHFKNAQHLLGVALPRTMCAYFVCVLSVLYTVPVLILHRESSSSSAITLCAHQSKRRTCIRVKCLHMHEKDLTAICDQTKKRNKAGISTRAFPLESSCHDTTKDEKYLKQFHSGI